MTRPATPTTGRGGWWAAGWTARGACKTCWAAELQDRWNITVRITQALGWDEDQKIDHDGEEKRFLYLDALCELASGEPKPVNPNEELKWVSIEDLPGYDHVPPGVKLFKKLGYL